jgi:hypothetical protein
MHGYHPGTVDRVLAHLCVRNIPRSKVNMAVSEKKTIGKDHSGLVDLIQSGFVGNKAISYTVGSSARRQHYLAHFLCSFGTSRDA